MEPKVWYCSQTINGLVLAECNNAFYPIILLELLPV